MIKRRTAEKRSRAVYPAHTHNNLPSLTHWIPMTAFHLLFLHLREKESRLICCSSWNQLWRAEKTLTLEFCFWGKGHIWTLDRENKSNTGKITAWIFHYRNHVHSQKEKKNQALWNRQSMIHNNNIRYAVARIERKLAQRRGKKIFLFWPRWPGSLRDSLVILKLRRESLLQQGKWFMI